MIQTKTTPQDRFKAALADLLETQLILLKHRIGELQEMPEEERAAFRDFLDSVMIIMMTYAKGKYDIEDLEALAAKYYPKGAGQYGSNGKTGRPPGRFTGR